MRGRISSGWRVSDGEFRLRATIPANTTATIHVPTTDAAGVTEGGGRARESEGVEFLREEDGAAVFAVGSGEYEFVGALR